MTPRPPLRVTAPPCGVRSPATIRSRVVLPVPLEPTRATVATGGTWRGRRRARTAEGQDSGRRRAGPVSRTPDDQAGQPDAGRRTTRTVSPSPTTRTVSRTPERLAGRATPGRQPSGPPARGPGGTARARESARAPPPRRPRGRARQQRARGPASRRPGAPPPPAAARRPGLAPSSGRRRPRRPSPPPGPRRPTPPWG